VSGVALWARADLRFRRGADARAAQRRLGSLADASGDYAGPATLPTAVVSLGKLRALPFALAVFFALLAIATVAHALVTTVRRRRHDLAVLRSIGFTRRDARVAIAWQATAIAIAGLVVGVPLGIVAGSCGASSRSTSRSSTSRPSPCSASCSWCRPRSSSPT
jgi:FtsX-like permease family